MNQENQSVFSAQQEVLQSPPMPEVPPDAQPKKRSRLVLLGGFGVLIVGLVLLMVVIGKPDSGVSAPEPTITQPPQGEIEQSKRDAIIDELGEKVKLANPKIEVVAPPPIDMKVEF